MVASPQRAKSPIPKISSARGSQIPAGIWSNSRRDLLDAIARASPMDEVGSMPTSSIKIERGQHIRFTLSVGTTWGGTPLTIIDPFPHRLSGGQSCGGTTFVVVPALLVRGGMLPLPVRAGRRRSDRLDFGGISLSERADSIIKT